MIKLFPMIMIIIAVVLHVLLDLYHSYCVFSSQEACLAEHGGIIECISL